MNTSIVEDKDCYNTGEVACPYCGYQYTDSHKLVTNDKVTFIQCEKCEECFDCYRYIEVTYTSNKTQTYTTKQAADAATIWCKNNPGWERICDLEEGVHDTLYMTWEELPKEVRAMWRRETPSDPEGGWGEFGDAICKIPSGHISGKGEFYESILDVPRFHQQMMVFETGKR